MKKFLFPFVLFLLIYKIYTITDNFYATTDSLPTNFNAINLINTGKLDLNNYRQVLEDGDLILITTPNKNTGSIYSKQPLMHTLLSVPYFYLFSKWYGLKDHGVQASYDQREILQIIGKDFASLLTAISAVILYQTLLIRFRKKSLALLGTLVYSFATYAFATSSQANGTHAIGAILVSLGYFLIQKLQTTPKTITTFLLGLAFAFAYMVRPVNIIFIAIGLVILITQKSGKKNIFCYLTSVGLSLLVYNLFTLFNHVPFGVAGEIDYSLRHINFITSLKVIATIIFSPNLGLLIYYPIIIFSFLGIFAYLKKRPSDSLLLFSFLSIVSIIGLNSIWWAWWAGHSWGSRMLTEASIPFTFFFVYYLSLTLLTTKKIIWLTSFLFLSIFNNLVGIFCNDFGWHAKYVRAGLVFQAAWNIQDPIFPYYLKRRYFVTKTMAIANDQVTIHNQGYLLVFKPLSIVPTAQNTLHFLR